MRYLTRAMAVPAESNVFNGCTGIGTTIVDLAKTVAGWCGVTPDLISRAPRPGDVRLSIDDPERAEKRFGIRAEMPLEDGLMMTLASQKTRSAARLRYA